MTIEHLVASAGLGNHGEDDSSVGAWRARGWYGLHPIIPPLPVDEIKLKRWADARRWNEAEARSKWAVRYGGKCPGGLDARGNWFGVNAQAPGVAETKREDFDRAWSCGAGVGVLGRCFGAIDVDVLDVDRVHRVRRVLDQVFGPERQCFVRYGRFPKFVMPFRWAEGPGTVRAHKLVLPVTRDEANSGALVERIEVLGVGTQWVLDGMHAGAGRPYSWWNNEIALSVQVRPLVDELPVLDRDALIDLLAAMRGAVGLPGPAGRVTGRWTTGAAAEAPAAPASGAEVAARLRGLRGPEALVREALHRMGNVVEYEGYIRVLHALKGASGGEGWGLDAWMAWCTRWPRDRPETNLDKWAGLSASGVRSLGAGWLINEAWKDQPNERARRVMAWADWQEQEQAQGGNA